MMRYHEFECYVADCSRQIPMTKAQNDRLMERGTSLYTTFCNRLMRQIR
jgi:hypothetical protein